MRINFAKAFLAGVAGTAAFDLLGLALTGKFWDVPSLLNARLFGGVGLGVGVFAHYVIGVLLAVIYAGVAPSLWGSRWTRALTYITAQTLFGVYLFMMPMLGLGVFGLEVGVLLPVFSMLRHWAYALVVEAVYPAQTRTAVTPLAAGAA
jgi:hypothetical protein